MNRNRTSLAVLLIAALLLALPGCLELTGQRISIRHDQANDRLLLLLCHDGIHENRKRDSADGAEQLAKHVEDGDIMILDWYGRLQREKILQAAGSEDTPPALLELARAFRDDVSAHAIGHYRDPDGRIGGAQLVVIANVRDFLRKANAAINEELIALADASEPRGLRQDAPRTFESLLPLAREARPWIALNGHAVTVSFPVDRREWSMLKAQFLLDLSEHVEETERKRTDDPHSIRPSSFVQFLAYGHIAEVGDVVTFRLGEEDEPAVLRSVLHQAYNDDLEKAVQEQVPNSFDDLLAAHLLGNGRPAEGSWQAVAAECSLPEDKVRAVLGAADRGREAAADAWLRAFARDWNRDVGLPRAPGALADRTEWEEWYRAMLWFPVVPEKP